jgi:hypothetical protein
MTINGKEAPMGWSKMRNGAKATLKRSEIPLIEIWKGEELIFHDDDLSLAQFLRKVVPQFQSLMEPYYRRLRAGEKLGIIEVFGMLELWRESIAFMWAGHEPHQQPAFEEKIRELWNEVRATQKQIYEKVEREYERRKAAS